jgi:hypothetical protein
MTNTVPTEPEGYHVTYTEDPAFPGNWFADLRDADGRVRESGQGAGQAAARVNLLERAERPETCYGRSKFGFGGVALRTLGGHVAALAEAGYEVHFGAHDGQAEAFIVKDSDTALAHGKTHAEALWTVSPLHADGVPFIVTSEGARASDLGDVYDRLDAVEGKLEDLGDENATLRLSWRVIADLVRVRIPDGFTARLGDTPHLGKEAYVSEVLGGCIAEAEEEEEELQRRAAQPGVAERVATLEAALFPGDEAGWGLPSLGAAMDDVMERLDKLEETEAPAAG